MASAGIDLSSLRLYVDRDGAVDLECDDCRPNLVVENPPLNLVELVAVAESHVRERHRGVVDGEVVS